MLPFAALVNLLRFLFPQRYRHLKTSEVANISLCLIKNELLTIFVGWRRSKRKEEIKERVKTGEQTKKEAMGNPKKFYLS